MLARRIIPPFHLDQSLACCRTTFASTLYSKHTNKEQNAVYQFKNITTHMQSFFNANIPYGIDKIKYYKTCILFNELQHASTKITQRKHYNRLRQSTTTLLVPLIKCEVLLKFCNNKLHLAKRWLCCVKVCNHCNGLWSLYK